MEMPIPPPLEVAADGDGHADRDQNIIRRSLNCKIHNNSSIQIEGENVRSANHKDDDDDGDDEEDLRSETSSIGVCSSISSAADENDIEVQSKRIDDPESDSDSNSNSLHQQHELELELHSNPNTNESSLTSLDSLEDSLPFKRGLSNFYCGKSKSFTSLSNVANATATAKDLVKPENPFNKRRRLLITCSRNRRASCSNLVSIAESPLLPLPPVLSECDDEDQDEDEEDDEDALVTMVMRRTRSDKEKKRPSLFTVTVSRQQQHQVFNEFDNDPHLPPFLTPKPSNTGTKMPLRLPGRSFSLSDLNQHAHAPP